MGKYGNLRVNHKSRIVTIGYILFPHHGLDQAPYVKCQSCCCPSSSLCHTMELAQKWENALQQFRPAISLFVLQTLFCSFAVFNPRVGHTMDVLSPFISVLCHSN